MKSSGLLGAMVAALIGLVAFTAIQAISDEERSRDLGEAGSEGRAVAPATDPLYKKECGACHLAYQPGWLPAASWKTIMSDLATHFGDNAELAPEARASIETYLIAHAADAPGAGDHSKTVLRSLAGTTAPLRITEIPYIARKHRGLPARLVRDNPEVRSLSQCNACHPRAAAGSFSENGVIIPGFGRWDD